MITVLEVFEIRIIDGKILCKAVISDDEGNIKNELTKPVYISPLDVTGPFQEKAHEAIEEHTRKNGKPPEGEELEELFSGLTSEDKLYKSMKTFLQDLADELTENVGIECKCPL